MAYNKQVNPYGIASSELGWRGFADGGKHGNPAAIAPPKDDIYKKLAMKALTDIGGAAWNEYTAPVNTGQSMWGDELAGFDTAIDAKVTGKDGALRDKNAVELEAAERAKADFIRSHPNAGKEIYNRPEWTENVPDFLMPGGSRYKVPEGSINTRQANAYRNNWKADRKFVPTPAPLAKKKTVVNPNPNAVTVDPNAVSTVNAKRIKEKSLGYGNTPGFVQVNPEHSSLRQGTSSVLNTVQLADRLDDVQNSLHTLKPEWYMNDAEQLTENKKDAVQSWMTGGLFSMSDAQTYFTKAPHEFAEFKKNPVEWYFTKGPGKNDKKDYSEHSWFGN